MCRLVDIYFVLNIGRNEVYNYHIVVDLLQSKKVTLW